MSKCICFCKIQVVDVTKVKSLCCNFMANITKKTTMYSRCHAPGYRGYEAIHTPLVQQKGLFSSWGPAKGNANILTVLYAKYYWTRILSIPDIISGRNKPILDITMTANDV